MAKRITGETDETSNGSDNPGIDGGTGTVESGTSGLDNAIGSLENAESGTGTGPATTFEPEPTTKRRGRKPGSKNTGKTAGQKTVLNRAALAGKLEGAHKFCAILTGIPLVEINASEADQMAGALCDVAQYYDLPVNGKTLAWIQLAATLGMIYGTRLYAYRGWKAAMIRAAMEADANREPSPDWAQNAALV
jgi:hypothetical protein